MKKSSVKKAMLLCASLLSLALSGCFVDSPTQASISLNSSTYHVSLGDSTVVTVTNSGTTTANNITITNGLPSGVTATSCNAPASGSCDFTISATDTASPQNGVAVQVGGSNTNTVSASLNITNTITADAPTYSVSITAGAPTTWAAVTNMSTSTVYNVNFVNLPSGFGLTAPSPCITIAPGATCNIQLTTNSPSRKSIAPAQIAGTNINPIPVNVGVVQTSAPPTSTFPGVTVSAAVANSDTAYIATNGSGVFYKKDKDLSWTAMATTGLPTSALNILDIAIDPNGNLFINNNNIGSGIYEWAQNGTSWKALIKSDTVRLPVILGVDGFGYLYVLGFDIFSSVHAEYLDLNNPGEGWKSVTGITRSAGLEKMASNANGTVVYADTTNAYVVSAGAVIKTIPLPTTPAIPSGYVFKELAISPEASPAIYIDYQDYENGGNDIVYYASTKGNSWTKISLNPGYQNIDTIAPIDANGKFYATTQTAVYQNNTAITPKYISNPPSNYGVLFQNKSLALTSLQLYFGASQGILKSPTSGISSSTWAIDNADLTAPPVTAVYVNGNTTYAGMVSTSLSGTTTLPLAYDSGNWNPIGNAMTNSNSPLTASTVESFIYFGGALYAATDAGVFIFKYSTNKTTNDAGAPAASWGFATGGSTFGVSNYRNVYTQDFAAGAFSSGTCNGSGCLFAIDHSSQSNVAYYDGLIWKNAPLLQANSPIVTSLYFDKNALYAGSITNSDTGNIYKMTTIGTWEIYRTAQAVAMTGDNTNLYWMNRSGDIYSCSLSLCTSPIPYTKPDFLLTGSIYQNAGVLYVGAASGLYAMRLATPNVWVKVYSGSSVTAITTDASGNLVLATATGVVTLPVYPPPPHRNVLIYPKLFLQLYKSYVLRYIAAW